jgi:hypothetical protein
MRMSLIKPNQERRAAGNIDASQADGSELQLLASAFRMV